METKKSNSRFRTFATVVYPESSPENWQTILSELKIPIFVSPLHDKDLNPTGEPKKPHYHVIAYFAGKKSCEQVREIFSTFGGVGCEPVSSLRGYCRYLCHLDNPEKAQYNINDVKCFGGADYKHEIGLPTDKYSAIREMMQFCDEHGNYSFADLLSYASFNREDWFIVLCDCGTLVMKEWLKSRTWKGGGSQ